MKKYIIISVLAIAFTSVFTSCKEDEKADTTKPVIELDEPEDGDELLIGAAIHFECDFSDDVMLGSYVVEIHNNFDHHSHKVASRAEGEEPFFYKKEFKFEQQGLRNAHVHHHDVFIPENAQEGDYHFIVYCTDAAGNQSLVAREIILSHDAEEHDHEHEHND